MIVRMNEYEIKQTIEGLRYLLQTMKGEEFVVSVPLEEDEPPMDFEEYPFYPDEKEDEEEEDERWNL